MHAFVILSSPMKCIAFDLNLSSNREFFSSGSASCDIFAYMAHCRFVLSRSKLSTCELSISFSHHLSFWLARQNPPYLCAATFSFWTTSLWKPPLYFFTFRAFDSVVLSCKYV